MFSNWSENSFSGVEISLLHTSTWKHNSSFYVHLKSTWMKTVSIEHCYMVECKWRGFVLLSLFLSIAFFSLPFHPTNISRSGAWMWTDSFSWKIPERTFQLSINKTQLKEKEGDKFIIILLDSSNHLIRATASAFLHTRLYVRIYVRWKYYGFVTLFSIRSQCVQTTNSPELIHIHLPAIILH